MLGNIIAFIVFFLIGIFGFCQVIGSIKYFRGTSSIITIVIWGALLTAAILGGKALFPDQFIAMLIAYGITFLLSLTVKPD